MDINEILTETIAKATAEQTSALRKENALLEAEIERLKSGEALQELQTRLNRVVEFARTWFRVDLSKQAAGDFTPLVDFRTVPPTGPGVEY